MKKFFAIITLLCVIVFISFCIYVGYRNLNDESSEKSTSQQFVPFPGTNDYFRISQSGDSVEASGDIVKFLAERLEKNPESIKVDSLSLIGLVLFDNHRVSSLSFTKNDSTILVSKGGSMIDYSRKEGLGYYGYYGKKDDLVVVLGVFNNEIKNWVEYFDSSQTKK